MLEHLSPVEARQTPLYAAVMATFLGRPTQCRMAACGRSATNHMWDAQTCPAREAAADE